jgi:uncharacterized repeat protein (TIGR03803 family)
MAGLVMDQTGNLYGTTWGDGSGLSFGTIFELSPESRGWQFTQLYVFGGASENDGAYPTANLILDQVGNLYGTTEDGGANISGTVFELSPIGGGQWSERILHSFAAAKGDGETPMAALIFDAQGNLYGTTYHGGASNNGSVFELSPNGDGTWSETVLYSFKGRTQDDGAMPSCPVVMDTLGNLYGATTSGGPSDHGIVFELSPTSAGQWNETVLHIFSGIADGDEPVGVALDSSGNLFGATVRGGSKGGGGTVFELSPTSGGAWTETIIHRFVNDTYNPGGPVTFDAAGSLYGVTTESGTASGSVYRLTSQSTGK